MTTKREVKCLCGDPLNADTSLAVCALETAVKELAKEVKALAHHGGTI